MIDLLALTALRSVDAHGSVVGAAAALGFTPSAVSQQVKRLERQTGVTLLERVGRGVVLTLEGRQLVEGGARVLADLEGIQASLHHRAGTVAGHLRVAAFSTAMRGLVAPVVRDLLETHADLELSLTEREPWDTVDAVAAGQAEVGVAHSWGDVRLVIPEHLVTTPLPGDEAEVVVPRDHRLAPRASVTPHDLVDEAWIATPEGSICREWLARMYEGTGRQPVIAHQALEFQSHLALVRAGLGIALVPRLGREPLTDDVVALRVHDPVPSRDVVAVHRRSMTGSPAVQAVVGALAAAPERDPA